MCTKGVRRKLCNRRQSFNPAFAAADEIDLFVHWLPERFVYYIYT